MSIVDNIRKQIADSVRNASADKNILRFLLGNLQTLESKGATINDELVISTAKSIIKSNLEGIEKIKKEGQTPPKEYVDNIIKENEILSKFLPAYLTKEETESKINENSELVQQISQAKNEGVAIGITVKYFKTLNLPVQNSFIKEIITNKRLT